jgi:hypothetical protein
LTDRREVKYTQGKRDVSATQLEDRGVDMKAIQVTISGHDFNGFVWENVFHLAVDIDPPSAAAILTATNSWVETTLIPPLLAAMSNQCTILDIASKYVAPGSSYTLHKAQNSNGTRDLAQDSGAVAGRLAWYPSDGKVVGHQFISGVCEPDYSNDYISDAYKVLLEAVRDAFLLLSGTDGIFVWQFVLYSRKTAGVVPIDAGEAMLRIGILSKRVRA